MGMNLRKGSRREDWREEWEGENKAILFQLKTYSKNKNEAFPYLLAQKKF